jgi:orotate phosphoribosyltransferase
MKPDSKALIVDDSLLSGKTMSPYRKNFPNAKFGAVYIKLGREKLVDTYYESLAPPRIFEWNLFKSRHLQNTMMDIDGILCRDPTKQECDYGLKMLEFYSTVKPRVIPSCPVLAYVTCRLERYRRVTDDWLSANGVPSENVKLEMRQRRSQGHGEFKAKVYKKSKAILFIESSLKQARVIAKLSGKPVLCYSTMEML